jgi:hypothetical protein
MCYATISFCFELKGINRQIDQSVTFVPDQKMNIFSLKKRQHARLFLSK